MIIVDTSVWIDHLRNGDHALVALLQNGEVMVHPWVIGELALGQRSHRREILGLLHNLPQAKTAQDVDVLIMIEHHRLSGLGIGYVDSHLLAAALLTTNANLWTRDRRLASAAERLGVGADRLQ